MNQHPYGYCPVCSAPGSRRERRPNGNDTCEKGHVYPTNSSLKAADTASRLAPAKAQLARAAIARATKEKP